MTRTTQFDDHITRHRLHHARAAHESPNRPRYDSADDYYQARDYIAFLSAKLAAQTVLEADPMHFWFGRQSN
jgi:hypothetical protein